MFAPLCQGLLIGLVSGYFLAFLLGQSIWLEMRLNIGWALPFMTTSGAVFFAWRKISLAYGWFFTLQTVTFALLFGFYGFATGPLLIVPACLLREGFFVDKADIGMVKPLPVFDISGGERVVACA